MDVIPQGSSVTTSEVVGKSNCGRGMALVRDREAMMKSRCCIVVVMKSLEGCLEEGRSL